jgi:hypothetical protein
MNKHNLFRRHQMVDSHLIKKEKTEGEITYSRDHLKTQPPFTLNNDT